MVAAALAALALSGCGQLLDGSKGGLGNMMGIPSRTPPVTSPAKPQDSKDCAHVGYTYDPVSLTLQAESRDGAVDQYEGVPPREHERLMAAASKCAYFEQHIRGVYRVRRLR